MIKDMYQSLIVKYFLKRKRPIHNYYKTKFNKNLLISYITYPFNRGINYFHTNMQESIKISEVFRDLEFNIDVVDYDYTGNIDYLKYDMILGFGDPLVKCFYNRNKKIKTIYYGTGMHVCHQNYMTLRRVKDVYVKTGDWLPESGRIVEKTWSVQTTLVDAMILLGNKIVEQSYRRYYDGPIYLLNPSFIEVISYENALKITQDKDFNDAKKNFLWFGSNGLIHKGLDLLLEFFKKRNDLQLHICGPINKETNFRRTFFNELYNYPNIHTYGFISIKSELFKELMKKCGFVVFPSCSEGGSPAVLNCMANGLIPIVTDYASIETKDFGVIIKGFKEEDILEAINFSISIESKKLQEMALKSLIYTRKNHNVNIFKSNFKKIIDNILQ